MITATSVIEGKEKRGGGNQKRVVDPSNITKTVGNIAFSSKDIVNEAAESARNAQQVWAAKTGAERSQLLYKLAEEINNHAEELAVVASQEMGKPITEMKGEIQRAVQLFKYYAAEGVRPDGETIPSSAPNVLQYAKRVPLGVVTLITPWNFPVAIPVWKIAPALICGNTVIWKPAENASLTASKMMKIFEKAGLPDGVINVIIGKGRDVGQQLMEEAAIDGLSFTGSTEVGKKVAETCSRRNIKCQTEMGGKNPAIVLKDADLSKTAGTIVSGAFRSAGQKCTATSRVIVETEIVEELKKALIEEMKNVKVAPACDPEAFTGPVASEEQYNKVKKYAAMAHKDGNIVVEGALPEEDGYYIPPLIVENIDTNHALWKEETFGPIITLVTASNVEEAVQLCNDTIYGLSASIFTNSVSNAHYFLENAKAGMVRVNQETAGVEYQAPFGGMKSSSSHTREQGQAALDFYSETKTCAINYGWHY
ncbi:aldehyde dehydrogenase (NAD+) [Alteribacillus bidgolensis]|uniref:Aldehyde dehydrogenase (NAD+) n=1 Tax=Alteribacillus bidgolensis TaxID=930129 RepID=A0A1G8HIB0_9BACI|nr:aldehyde dehydrogenase family protein [Alteribacillus bidgolensis]SDI06302.1 aldehyde dehydrogenase (NAD+) [Alteribacillus bidgolensis]